MGAAPLSRWTDCSKFKSPNHQDGTVYLTSHRVCYIDEVKPMLNSIGVGLDQIDKIETSVERLRADIANTSRLVSSNPHQR